MTRLAELLPTYKDKLQDKDVYSNFVGLVNRAKQFASQEMAQAVDEWKSQLEKVKEPRRSQDVKPNNQCRRFLLTMIGGALAGCLIRVNVSRCRRRRIFIFYGPSQPSGVSNHF